MHSLKEDTANEIWINGYRIQRMDERSLREMNILFREVYQRSLPVDYYQRKYQTAYTGKTNLGYLAFKEQELVAYYGVIPCFTKQGSQRILSAQSADTMTHPGHRNKGLFVILAELTYRLCQQEGIQLLFGFPNEHSLPGFIRKLDWQIVAHMECFVISVKPILPLEKIIHKLPCLGSFYQRYIRRSLSDYLQDIPGLSNTRQISNKLSVHKDDAYLNYKHYHKTSVIRIANTFIWFKIQQGFIIGDIDGPEWELDLVMERIHKFAIRLGTSSIRIQVSPGARLYPLLKKRYPSFPTFPVILKQLDPNLSLKTEAIDFCYADIDIF